MAAPASAAEFVDLVDRSQLVPADRLAPHRPALNGDAKAAAGQLVVAGLLTRFQADQLLAGKWRGFALGKYRLLERLGVGGMATVYLAEHTTMRRWVAVKVLPPRQADEPAARERFLREARAAGALAHPNIVRAYDIDQAGNVHFLVMEYVDGASLHQLVRAAGPLAPARAAQYLWQAAVGLQHAHEAGLVHRDVKPANLLVDRQGVVKLLDLGLARFFHDDGDSLTKQHDGNSVLGTADFLAPEQAADSHGVDIRADIYSLGATAYFLLTGRAPFADGTTAQKIIAHSLREPKPIGEQRSDVPPALLAVVAKMMAKAPADRYQTPGDVAAALAEWGHATVPPPTDDEMPQLCAALAGGSPTAAGSSAYSGVRAAAVQSLRGGPASTAAPLAAAETATATPVPAPPPRKRSKLPAVGVAAALVAVGAGAWVGGTFKSRPSESPRPSVGTTVEAVGPKTAAATPPPASAPPPAERVVRRSPAAGEFASVKAAVAAARSGDTVVLRDPDHREALILTAADLGGKALTVRGQADGGAPVVWRPAGDGPLVDLTDAAGLTLAGLRFDGGGTADTLVTVHGTCPGLTLDGVGLTGFRKAGVALLGASGDATRPIRLHHVRAHAAAEGAEAALLVRAEPGPVRHVALTDSRVEGPLKAGVHAYGDVGLAVERNRVWQVAAGVLLERATTTTPMQAAIVHNTFADVPACVQVQGRPPVPGSEIGYRDNLSLRSELTARMVGFRLAPVATPAKWVWFAGDPDPLHNAPPGTRYFRLAFDLPAAATKATLDCHCDDEYAAFVNGHAVGKFRGAGHLRRVVATDVTARLVPGRNVLAVSGLNLANPAAATNTAALLARLRVTLAGGATREFGTDAGWTCSDAKRPGWETPAFDDAAWPAARVVADHNSQPFHQCQWDSEVFDQIGDVPGKLFPSATGNVRDPARSRYTPWVPDAKPVRFDLPTDPADDATFLRYPPDSPLATTHGAPGAP